ncbi:MAG TPA: aspartate aminotransferase family protein [Solirubrobacterales bacterium]|nr:aspartate aminotransferase family protein [Solirubrobacterales bacterium]
MRNQAWSAQGIAAAIGWFSGGGVRRFGSSAEIVADHGSGSYVYESSGSRYLDAVSGFGVASLGHCHPRWVESVTSQAARLGVTPLYTEELAKYLAALAEALPPRLNKTALFSGGAEAVEVAIRLAQRATGRRGILTFEGSFHGKTLGVRYSDDAGGVESELIGPAWLRSAPFPACERHDPLAYAGCEEPVTEALAAIERRDLDEVGAVLIEPVQGTAGNIPPRRGLHAALRRLCDERGWLLLFDEMITGFGRTGLTFGFESFGVEPDVLILGKGLGGGYPLSAVCSSADLWKAASLDHPSATATSYGGNPIACAAGMATLEIITDGQFLASVAQASRQAAERLRELSTSPRVAWPRGIGLMLGFDLVDAESGALASPVNCLQVVRDCRDRGLLIAADVPRVRLSPPLTISPGEVDELFDVLTEVLA